LKKNVFVKIQCDALTGDSLEELVWNHQAAKFNLISSILGGTPRKTKIPWISHQGWDQRASHAKWSVLRIKKKNTINKIYLKLPITLVL
jgi:hypothetical protein